MNKVINTNDRVFMSMVGPSGCGKTQLIYDMLKNGTFQPGFNKILYFYEHYQPIYEEMWQKVENIEFIQNVDFDMIKELPSNGTNYLPIFDDSCEEICKNKEFQKLATAGRHKKLNTIYIKHNLFHKSPIGRDAELQNTQIVLFKSPRDVQQISRLGNQLGLGKQFNEWYKDAVSKPFGHLMVDLHPRTDDKLRFCTNCGSFPTQFYLPKSQARITEINDEHTKHKYSQALPIFYETIPKSYRSISSQRVHSLPMRVSPKSSGRKPGRSQSKSTSVSIPNSKVGIKKRKHKRATIDPFFK